MEKSFNEVYDLLQEYIKEDSGMIDLGWCGELLYPFYKHFNDNDIRYRAGSLIAFFGLLEEWELECGFPFCTGKFDINKSHHFDKYIEEFLKYSSNIEEQLPHINKVIIYFLMLLDKRDGFENTFPNINNELFKIIRKQLFGSEILLSDDLYIKAFREANIDIS
ncbi:hypothetical protein [Bacillus massiliigorillae]|uniref:hypothetical protein n=1 Tax=Bacillus massiliigorillae TaxID=1243664 RepID=UPI0003A1B854|nr:hypothetical protein [Bacillus massiliigorillae]